MGGRACRHGRLKCTKTEGSVRAVPLQAVALEALERLPAGADTELLFPSLRGASFDLHNFRTREWKPAQLVAGITPLRRVYDLRHTFATFALRAGISTFDLSRYMGARRSERRAPTLPELCCGGSRFDIRVFADHARRATRSRWANPTLADGPSLVDPVKRASCPACFRGWCAYP
jgi:hypothetical protein